MNQPGWKSVLVGSAIALASQTALSNKPTSGDTDRVSVDTVWAVQSTTKQRVENHITGLGTENAQSSPRKVFWFTAAMLALLGGGLAGGNVLRKRNLKKNMKWQIFELDLRFKAEKSKYPAWFRSRYARDAEVMMKILNGYSDDNLDGFIRWWESREIFLQNVSIVEGSFRRMEIEYQEILQTLELKKIEVNAQRLRVLQEQTKLLDEGFQFWESDIPPIREWRNPNETLSLLHSTEEDLEQLSYKFSSIRDFYNSIQWLDERVQTEFDSLKTDLAKFTIEYTAIYGSTNLNDTTQVNAQILMFKQDFQALYAEKNIRKLETLVRQKESLLSPLSSTIESMRFALRWYNDEVPSKLEIKQQQILWIQVKPEYARNAQMFAEKTGERTFLSYDMWATLLSLQEIIRFVTDAHREKKHLTEIDIRLKVFDVQYATMKEYMSLGPALAAIFAEEALEAECAIKRKREQKIRDDEAQVRARQSAEEAKWKQKDDDDDTPVQLIDWGSNDGWSDGGWDDE